ncbi:unnamed protein product [Prorocentrum cordatum]|uniref:Uncharacterized protein n=1 Tax=Prorocentrum cordatum TaxID=2364126 RepID=A0ABN9VLL9_9DINO|nr:unnamed protein product [Polarella glacialis]
MVELREDSPRPREDRRADAEARPAGKGAPAENAPGGAGALSAAAAAEREPSSGGPGEWSGDDTDSDPEARTARAAPAPPPADVVERLRCYGFLARSAGAWTEQAVPVVRLRVRVHTEVDGHTCYIRGSRRAEVGRWIRSPSRGPP